MCDGLLPSCGALLGLASAAVSSSESDKPDTSLAGLPGITGTSSFVLGSKKQEDSQCQPADAPVLYALSGGKPLTQTRLVSSGIQQSYATHTSEDFEKIWKRLLENYQLTPAHI